MSLPLSRRIARAALLVGGAAAPIVGASAASAAALPQAPALGGLTNVDGTGVTTAVNGATQRAGHAAGDTSGRAVKSAVPAIGKSAAGLGDAAVPAARQQLGSTAGTATGLVGDGAKVAKKAGPVGGQLPVGGSQLPVG